jgi:Protein of unknown function (DUF4238)
VPQSYLRRFTRGGQVTQIELSSDHRTITTSVRNVAAEQWFHLIEQPDGRSTLQLERDIAQWEGWWNTAIGRLVDHGFEDPEFGQTFLDVTDSVAFQFLRTTLAREQGRHHAKTVGALMDQYGGRPPD